jgi:hypothetical protein
MAHGALYVRTNPEAHSIACVIRNFPAIFANSSTLTFPKMALIPRAYLPQRARLQMLV